MVIANHRLSLRRVAMALENSPSSRAADLVNVAAQIYAADRRVSRGRSWARSMPVNIMVADTAVWARCAGQLQQALKVLTDDNWEFRFSTGRHPLPEEQQPWLVRVRSADLNAVALFSGGLDSLAGAACWLNEHPHEVLGLVSISSSTVTGKVQRDLASMLARAYQDRVVHLVVPLNLIRAPDVERSQRSRGLLYSAIATAIAECAGAQRVLVFENGYGAINPRLLESQVGSQATKSTHPYVLTLLDNIYRRLGFASQIDLPYITQTKAELVRGMPPALRAGIRLTVSCDSFPLRNKNTKQCGDCGSCILRQQALKSAQLDHFDRIDYARPAFKAERCSRQLALMAYQARVLTDSVTSELPSDLARKWPELFLGYNQRVPLERIEWFDMLRRYGLEWRRIVASDRALSSRIGWRVNS